MSIFLIFWCHNISRIIKLIKDMSCNVMLRLHPSKDFKLDTLGHFYKFVTDYAQTVHFWTRKSFFASSIKLLTCFFGPIGYHLNMVGPIEKIPMQANLHSHTGSSIKISGWSGVPLSVRFPIFVLLMVILKKNVYTKNQKNDYLSKKIRRIISAVSVSAKLLNWNYSL